jgi:hypothetical protein
MSDSKQQSWDISILAAIVLLLVSAMALGGSMFRLAFAAACITGVGYLAVRPALLSKRRRRVEAATEDTEDTDPLWRDTEAALAVFDRYPVGGSLADTVLRTARLAREAVEAARQAPAEQASAQVRHLVCLAGDALKAYVDAGEPEDSRSELASLLNEVANALSSGHREASAEDALRLRLKVLKNEIGG